MNRSLTLAGVLARDSQAEGALRAAIGRHPGGGFSPEALERRLSHFIAEDGRVLPALEAFRRGDRDRLGDLSSASQADAEHLLAEPGAADVRAGRDRPGVRRLRGIELRRGLWRQRLGAGRGGRRAGVSGALEVALLGALPGIDERQWRHPASRACGGRS